MGDRTSVTSSKPPHACVRFADPSTPDGMEVSTAKFLGECQQAAWARFGGGSAGRDGNRTVEHSVPPKPGDQGSTGMIVAHASAGLLQAWEASASGTPAQRRSHVESELHLALDDLADQDMHGYLAMTDELCAIFDPDLVQLLAESLDRTSFSHLGRKPEAHWEGTLVERVQPPYIVLVVSLDLERGKAGKAARSRAPRPKALAAKHSPGRSATEAKATPARKGRKPAGARPAKRAARKPHRHTA